MPVGFSILVVVRWVNLVPCPPGTGDIKKREDVHKGGKNLKEHWCKRKLEEVKMMVVRVACRGLSLILCLTSFHKFFHIGAVM